MIQIAPTMAAGAGPHKPGAAMTPVAGCVPALLDAATGAEIPAVIGEEAKGLLVLKQPWPSMARTCWGDHERFENTYFSYDGYYLTGDGARRDADGHYWITGRVDDVVVVSGHNIGTAEVESALVAHPAVSFCGVLVLFLPFLFCGLWYCLCTGIVDEPALLPLGVVAVHCVATGVRGSGFDLGFAAACGGAACGGQLSPPGRRRGERQLVIACRFG